MEKAMLLMGEEEGSDEAAVAQLTMTLSEILPLPPPSLCAIY